MDTVKMGRLIVKEGVVCPSRTIILGVTSLMLIKLSGSVLNRLFGLEEYQVFRESGKLLIYGQVGCRGGWDKNVPGQNPDGRQNDTTPEKLDPMLVKRGPQVVLLKRMRLLLRMTWILMLPQLPQRPNFVCWSWTHTERRPWSNTARMWLGGCSQQGTW